MASWERFSSPARDNVLFDTGWQLEMVLQSPFSVDVASVAAAVDVSLEPSNRQLPIVRRMHSTFSAYLADIGRDSAEDSLANRVRNGAPVANPWQAP
jgi:hypothetical protein